MQSPTKSSLVGTFIGKYCVSREIGRGGFGVVYEVIQQSIGHRAAAKLLSPQLATDPKHQKYVERFNDEARATNLINHPGVIKIFDLGELPDHTLYILMEYLDGEPLQSRIDKYQLDGKRLSPRKVFQIGSQLAGAMAQAHDKGVIHRDLKPENVFLIPDQDVEGRERCKLLDFGLARFLDSPERRTTAGMTLGTPTYLSPAQCMGLDSIDGRTDVYSLGVLLYQLLAGVPPFVGDMGRVMRAHCGQLPAPLSARTPHISARVSDFVMSLLLKDPAQRMQMRQAEKVIEGFLDSGELSKEELQGGVSVPAGATAAPTTVVQAQRAPSRSAGAGTGPPRNMLIAAAAVASVLALGAGFLGGRITKDCPPAPNAAECPAAKCPDQVTCPACPTEATDSASSDGGRAGKGAGRLREPSRSERTRPSNRR